MSAIGATRWYHEVPRARHEQDVVPGRYQVQFLREVRGLVGNSFFSSQYAVCCEFWDVYESPVERTRRLRDDEDGPLAADCAEPGRAFLVGTMLPFNRHRDSSRIYRQSMPFSPAEDADLPANSTWELGGDGRIVMRQVSLVASSDPEFYPADWVRDQYIWRIVGPDTDNPRRLVEVERASLDEYLRGKLVPFLPSRARHAVLTTYSATMTVAAVAILMQVYEDEEPVKTFAKVADFELDSTRPPGPEGKGFSTAQVVHEFVDWEVL